MTSINMKELHWKIQDGMFYDNETDKWYSIDEYKKLDWWNMYLNNEISFNTLQKALLDYI